MQKILDAAKKSLFPENHKEKTPLVTKHFCCRDPTYLEYLDKIGQNFFGVAPPVRARPGGMFGGMFDSLLNVLGKLKDHSQMASLK